MKTYKTEMITYNELGLKLAIINAKSNLESATTQTGWNIKGAKERMEFWTTKLEELLKLKNEEV